MSGPHPLTRTSIELRPFSNPGNPESYTPTQPQPQNHPSEPPHAPGRPTPATHNNPTPPPTRPGGRPRPPTLAAHQGLGIRTLPPLSQPYRAFLDVRPPPSRQGLPLPRPTAHPGVCMHQRRPAAPRCSCSAPKTPSNPQPDPLHDPEEPPGPPTGPTACPAHRHGPAGDPDAAPAQTLAKM